MHKSKLIGILVACGGFVWGGLFALLFYAGVTFDDLSVSAAIMGWIIFGLIPFTGGLIAGIILIHRGAKAELEQKSMELERDVLNAVTTRGEVQFDAVAVEAAVPVRRIEEAVQSLVGKRLFTGYVDWKSRRLYSVEASQIADDSCPNCGGQMGLAGKGVVKCDHCGSEVFLPQ